MTVQVDVLRPDDRPRAAWVLTLWKLLAPRVPQAVIRALLRGMLLLPRGSRARRWSVLTAAVLGWEVTGRGDLDFVLPFWDRGCEWHWDTTFRSLGFDEVYRGHEGVGRALRNWNEIWTDRSFVVREVLDGGDTWVMRTTASGRGAASGANTRQDFTSVCRLNPLIVDFRNFADHEAALRDAGFPEPNAPRG
jgi:hypothetical protein